MAPPSIGLDPHLFTRRAVAAIECPSRMTAIFSERGCRDDAREAIHPRTIDCSGNLDSAVIVAMVAMGMVEPAVDQIINMIAVRDRLMTARRTVNMTGLVALVTVFWRAVIRIGLADLDHMFIDMVAVRMVQMAVMQVINVVPVAYRGVPATGSMLMRMIRMNLTSLVGHIVAFPCFWFTIPMVFARMLDRIVDEMQNVGVGEGIDDCLAPRTVTLSLVL